jgi:hypothetical protein
MNPLTAAALLTAVMLATSACASGGASNADMHPIRVAVISNYSIHVGQARAFGHLRPGDNVACLGRADSISLIVPRHGVGTTTQTYQDKRLSLTLVSESHGRNTAHCHARHP